MTTTRAWLIYRGRDGSMRVITRSPNLYWDEIAWRITVNVPGPWARIAGDIEVTLPEAPPASVTVTEIEVPSS